MLRRSSLCWLSLLVFYPSMTETGFASLAYPKVTAALEIEPLQAALQAQGGARSVRIHKVRARDSLGSILRRWGVAEKTILALSSGCKALLQSTPRFLRPGRTVQGTFAPEDGALLSVEIQLDDEQQIVIRRSEAGEYTAGLESVPLERRTVRYRVVVKQNLLESAKTAGVPSTVLSAVAELYVGQLDLETELVPGDTLSVVGEAVYRRGNLVEHGPILAAEVTTGGRSLPLFRFRDSYYDREGRSPLHLLLRTPLLQYRVSSDFRNRRAHPITGRKRPHYGIDLAAPVGTPVRAAGDGRVEFVGLNGGYGRMIKVEHDSSWTTLYAHLSRFAPALAEGQEVRQGQIIGYVGQSGLASGPHLHYEMQRDGRYVDPLTVDLPVADPVTPADWPDFQRQIEGLSSMLLAFEQTGPIVLTASQN